MSHVYLILLINYVKSSVTTADPGKDILKAALRDPPVSNTEALFVLFHCKEKPLSMKTLQRNLIDEITIEFS